MRNHARIRMRDLMPSGSAAFMIVAVPLMLSGAAAPSAEHLDDRYLAITDHPEREELVIALGPIDLPAHTSHHALKQLPVQQGTVPFDLTFHGFRVEVVDRNGNRVPQVVLHHFNLLDPQNREIFLPIMRRVLAASKETKPQHVPGWLFGAPLKGGDRFIVLTMLHNPTDQSYEDVSVRLVLEYERGRFFPLLKGYAFHLDVMFPLGSKAFDLPPGRLVKSWEGSPAIGGRIVAAGGHVHDYATSLVLEDITSDKVIYEADLKLDPEGRILEVPVETFFGLRLGKKIYPDHRYRVRVTYFNPTGDTIRGGGMGSVAGAFLPEDTPWLPADPDDPVYKQDYENVVTSLGH